MNGSQMPRRNRDKRQVNAAIGMCIGLAIGAVGMAMCTRLGYEEYATIPVIVCLVLGGIIGTLGHRTDK